jgi:hypothetical protein
MSDPRRILESDGEGRELLESAAQDQPSAEARNRAFAAMMATASAPAPASRWRLSAGKVIAGAALIAAGAGVALFVSSRTGRRPQAISTESAPPVPPPSVPPAPPTEPTVAPPAISPPSPHKRAPAVDDLGAEVKLLDEARSALAHKDVDRAQRALDRYRERFPSGRLSEESVPLRIQALLARNEKVKASNLATRFLAEHPQSPLVPRVRALLEQCE